ncbi:putative Meiotically up-regulated gene 157 protein [Seiridium unicorne]|uniref:Meiotically up-regulated gene 157 protein n=1 Tax=Seiridium unicorne TaxID=138068 RepID=A0ABR2V8F4_9PEZI
MWSCGRLYLAAAVLVGLTISATCPNYANYSRQKHEPLSEGAFGLSSMRPEPACRTFNSTLVEDAILRLKHQIWDPDLFRLFENTWPNTLDTAIKWQGVAANNTQEELCFVITGDINAMWVRDSANQIAPYKYVLHSATDDVAAVFRGVINLQARYLVINPYCNAFQPPTESGMSPDYNGGIYSVTPPYDKNFVYTCNFELDDFGGFLQLSHDYYAATGDVDFFGKFQWIYAIQSILSASKAMQQPSYDEDGVWIQPAYTFQSQTMSASGTLGNGGTGSPVNYTGLMRSPFRPSDDSAIFDLNIPANMMMARYLDSNAAIMEQLPNAPSGLAQEMRDMATQVREGIKEWGIITAPNGKRIYAYEVDGYGGRNLMDDANIPSLLSAPFLGFLNETDEIYQNTRSFVLSRANPWYCSGPIINGVGSPHVRPGATWPMSTIMRAMTTNDDKEIITAMKEVLQSTASLGLIHESVDAYNAARWTRQWFTWANGLFGQLIMELEQRKPALLQESFQPLFKDRD